MIVCYKCGKQIKGQAISNNPPIYLIKLGVDFPKSYHPKCYKQAEIKARKDLGLTDIPHYNEDFENGKQAIIWKD